MLVNLPTAVSVLAQLLHNLRVSRWSLAIYDPLSQNRQQPWLCKAGDEFWRTLLIPTSRRSWKTNNQTVSIKIRVEVRSIKFSLCVYDELLRHEIDKFNNYGHKYYAAEITGRLECMPPFLQTRIIIIALAVQIYRWLSAHSVLPMLLLVLG